MQHVFLRGEDRSHHPLLRAFSYTDFAVSRKFSIASSFVFPFVAMYCPSFGPVMIEPRAVKFSEATDPLSSNLVTYAGIG